MQVSCFSHQGMVRTKNEDSYLVVPPWREPALSRHFCLFAVADGMGGHAKGEVASGLAVKTLLRLFDTLSLPSLDLTGIQEMVVEANHAVFEHAQKNPDCKGMGTTLTLLVIGEKQAWIAHVGDSRAYLLRAGELRQLTNDHSLVAEQIRAGLMRPEDVRTYPGKHVITRALGIKEFVDVETHQFDLVPGDVLCLMSDGVSGEVPDPDICRILGSRNFSHVAKELVMDANSAGGGDNSTVVAVRIGEVPPEFPPRYSWKRLRALFGDWLGV